MDFLWIAERVDKRGVTEIYPKFIVRKSSDLMIRGKAEIEKIREQIQNIE